MVRQICVGIDGGWSRCRCCSSVVNGGGGSVKRMVDGGGGARLSCWCVKLAVVLRWLFRFCCGADAVAAGDGRSWWRLGFDEN